ncbi:MAG TPA: phosphopantetheine-binding protein [Burkholderiaceae bacterium]|nr:phosphopantetheine-binding protein [Burkholderiaceae bacterium]
MVELKTLSDLIAGLDVVPDMSRFDSNKSFRDNGIDSLDVMTVFLAVEENYGIKISEDESLRINSPAQLLSTINARG